MRKYIFAGLLVLIAGITMAAQINTSARCSTGSDCNIGNGKPSGITLDTDGGDLNLDGTTANSLTLTATTTASPTFIGADAATPADTVFTTTGTGTVTVGTAGSTTGVTLTTDGSTLNIEGTQANQLTLTAATTGTMVIMGQDASDPSNLTIDTGTTGTITVGSIDVGALVLSVAGSADSVQVQAGATGTARIDFRDYGDTTDDDMAHSIIDTNCSTATTGAEECDMNISITTAGSNIEVLAIDPAGGMEYGDATTTAHTFTSAGGAVVMDGFITAQRSVVSQTAGSITVNTVTLATAAGDYTIADDLCALTADIGNWFTIIIEDVSTVVKVDPLDASDQLFIAGIDVDPGHEIDSASTGDFDGAHITMVCMAVNQWYATSVTRALDGTAFWTDGGAS